MNKESRFFWIDLEMTGLNISRDVILEVASLITDTELNIIEQGPHHVIYQPGDALNTMIPIVQNMHSQSGLINLVKNSNVTLQQAYKETYEFIKKHCFRRNTFLAGNSVWMDRIFLEKYMPKITDFIHYRIIDVSTIKLLTQSWYPNTITEKTEKKSTHRALDDIQESLNELKNYRSLFFK